MTDTTFLIADAPNAPTIPTTDKPRWLAHAIVAVGATFCPLLISTANNFPSFGEDSYSYREYGLTHWSHVTQPFSARFLHPFVIHATSRAVGVSVDAAFMIVALAALAGFLTVMALLYRRLSINPLWIIPALFCASSMSTLQLVFMPDQSYSLLLSIFLAVLSSGALVTAALGLVILFCARESTLLVGVSAIAAVPRASSQWFRHVAVFTSAIVVGMLINRRVSSLAAGNVHHVSPLLYLLAKAPYNFLKNVFGIEVWTDTLQAIHPNLPCMFKTALPGGLHIGGVSAVGIAEVSLKFPANWLASALGAFGVLLTVVSRSMWLDARTANVDDQASLGTRIRSVFRPVRRSLLGEPFFLQVATIYGLLSFLVVPLLGTATSRYVYYAWPLFWLLGTQQFVRNYLPAIRNPARHPDGFTLLFIHLLLGWLPIWWPMTTLYRTGTLGSLAVALLLHAVAWRKLRSLCPVTQFGLKQALAQPTPNETVTLR